LVVLLTEDLLWEVRKALTNSRQGVGLGTKQVAGPETTKREQILRLRNVANEGQETEIV
jgi:hypothetical protein